MPPPADSTRVPRRPLGGGPGAPRPGASPPTPPVPEPGAEPSTPPVPSPRDEAEPPAPPAGTSSPGASPAPDRLDDGRAPEPVAQAEEGQGGTGSPAPEAPETPYVPEPRDVSEAPDQPAPETPAVSEAPDLPDAPGAPDVPGPDAPDAPDAPDPAPERSSGGDGAGSAAEEDAAGDGRFTVRLVNFEGPFDLLLQLISKHKLDVTEVALSKVTDEFMAHIRGMGNDWDLDQTTEFLVVAATLLDLKAARLLPSAEVEDEADLALLEARDLLFARLLQYRAYKQIAEIFSARLDAEARRYPRTVGLEDHHAELLPDVVISIGPDGFARLAVKAMQPKPKPQVYVDHIHAPLVSVREQGEIVVAMLRERGQITFRELADDAEDTLTVVARFLALLELYRDKAVSLAQEDALGELLVQWTGGDADATVTDEFDRPPEITEEKA